MNAPLKDQPGPPDPKPGQPPYTVDVEGTLHEWHKPTISAAEIAQLGGWALSAGVIEIDKDGNERQLQPDEVVELKPGLGFSKKVRWKRGYSQFDVRLDEELVLLKGRFADARREGVWFWLPNIVVPAVGWNLPTVNLAVRAHPGHPATPPYGLYVTAGLRIGGAPPDSYQEPVGDPPPFPGPWGMFSWAPEEAEWRPTVRPVTGANLLNFALSIFTRLGQGK